MSYNNRIVVFFLATVLLLCAVGASVYTNFVKLKAEKHWVDHTYEVIITLDEIIINVLSVQSAQRGYIITGYEDYLSPYSIAVPKATESVRKLLKLVGDNEEQNERAESLALHVRERLEIAETVIQTYQKKGERAAFTLVQQGNGKREMDQIHAIVADMVAAEQNFLIIRQGAVENSSKATMYIALGGTLICLIILVAAFTLIHRETRRRAKTEDTLRNAFAGMERHSDETKTIARLGDYLRGCRVQDEAYDMIASNMPMIFPSTYGSVSIFNNSHNLLSQVLCWGDLPEGCGNNYDPDSCWALRQGRMHHSPGDGSVPICGHLTAVEKTHPSICIPMQAQGETIGQIFMGTKDTNDLGQHQLATIRTVSEQISLALANLKLQQALKEQSIKDPLTKLFNRRYLEETLTREVARAQREEKPLSVLIMDIDHFKRVNDTYGHEGGDAVLVAFARMLTQMIRAHDIACRLGGEEFVIVQPGASWEQAERRAKDICAAFRGLSVKVENQVIQATVSIGISSFPEDAETPDDLLRKADMALYEAKNTGRNRTVLYNTMSNAA